jgi:heme exporter protein C
MAARAGGTGTGSRATRWLGAAALVTTGATVVLGMFVTEPDVVQGDAVRIIYLHPAIAWTAYLAFGVTAVASILYLWKRTRSRLWDLVAGASAEIGVLFIALTLVLGSIWGRATWGVWWTWEARLTTTALLLALFLGYLALRRVPAPTEARSKRSAVVALIAAADIPIVHMSVEWWRTLHQGRTVLRSDPTIEGLQLQTLLLGIVAMTLVYAWLLLHRFRVELLEEKLDDVGLARAIEERQAEAVSQ